MDMLHEDALRAHSKLDLCEVDLYWANYQNFLAATGNPNADAARSAAVQVGANGRCLRRVSFQWFPLSRLTP